MQRSLRPKPDLNALRTALHAKVLRHDAAYGLSTLFFGDGELRVPLVDAPVGSGVRVTIDARDVSIALSRPMDVSITNRLPGTIVAIESLALPYVRVTFDLGTTRLDALVTTESVERLGLELGLRAWAMIKTVAIGKDAVQAADIPTPRRWPVVRAPDRAKR
jgi:molybdate transport system ATP-binding protein